MEFVARDATVAIEAKASPRITNRHLKGLRKLRADQPSATTRAVVSIEPAPRLTEDGIGILPPTDFIDTLWSGDLI